MLKKSIILVLVLFFTQSVLAGIDLHANTNNMTDNNATTTIDIIEHYIDSHNVFSSINHKCQFDSSEIQSDNTHSHTKNTDSDDQSVTSHDYTASHHHHECHGHTTALTFTSTSSLHLIFTTFQSRFSYILSDYSITLKSPKRPPIAA
jgi:hypothetical protein